VPDWARQLLRTPLLNLAPCPRQPPPRQPAPDPCIPAPVWRSLGALERTTVVRSWSVWYTLSIKNVSHAISATMTTDLMASQSDIEYIQRAECPLCKNGPRKGSVNPRRALQEHLRSSTDPAHSLWRQQWYTHHFRHGGAKVPPPRITAERIVYAIRNAFGEEWSSKVRIEESQS
jgi:hypothetical protein